VRKGRGKMPKALIGIATYAVAIIMAVAVFTPQGSQQAYAQESDPMAVVEAFGEDLEEALTTGNGALVAGHFTEGGYVSIYGGGTFGGSISFVGHQAITLAFSGPGDSQRVSTLVDSSVEGHVVTTTIEVSDASSIAAGIDRYVQLGTTTVEGDKVASVVVEYDASDPETVELVQWEEDNITFDDAAPPGSSDIGMTGTQPGTATVGDFGGAPFIALVIDAGASGVPQPAHVHTGTCEDPGGIVYPLANVIDGVSITVLSTTIDSLLNSDYIANVHLSAEEPGTYVSCAALETADGGPVLPSTGTGGGQTKDSDTNVMMWLIVGLAIGGIGGIAGAGYLVTRRR
jgi:hypothetical protein